MRRLFFHVAFFLVLCSPAIASDWYCEKLGRDSLVDATSQWQRRDGGIGSVVSNQFLFLLAACPQETYSFMQARPELLDSWLDEVEDVSGLTDSPAKHEELEITLSKLVASMSGQKPGQKTAEVRARILKRLETMCVRTVDETPPRPPCQRVALPTKP
jgi:hypothetical protein